MSFFANKYVITGIRMAEIIALTILPTPSCAVTAYVTILTMNPRAANAKISTKPIFLCAKSKIPIETVMTICSITVSYTHLRAHETDSYLVCRLLLEKKKKKNK